MRRLWGCHARAALPSGSRSVGLGSSADGSWAERKASESATLIQVSHPRGLPSESIRKRIDRLVRGHPDWRLAVKIVAFARRAASGKSAIAARRRQAARSVASSRRGYCPLPTEGGRSPDTCRRASPSATSAPRQNGGTDRASWSRRTGTLRQQFPAAPTVACAICSPRTTSMSRLADASQRRTG